jgi:hypothetical protein
MLRYNLDHAWASAACTWFNCPAYIDHSHDEIYKVGNHSDIAVFNRYTISSL